MDLETNYDFSVRRQLIFLPASHHWNILYGPLPACNRSTLGWYELLNIPKSTLACWWQDVASCSHGPGFSHVYKDCESMRVMQTVGMLLCIHWVLVFILLVRAAKVEQVKFDTTQLHARPELAAEQRMVDDASGEIEVRELLLLIEDAVTSVFPNVPVFPHTPAVWSCEGVPTHLPSPRKHGCSQTTLLVNSN